MAYHARFSSINEAHLRLASHPNAGNRPTVPSLQREAPPHPRLNSRTRLAGSGRRFNWTFHLRVRSQLSATCNSLGWSRIARLQVDACLLPTGNLESRSYLVAIPTASQHYNPPLQGLERQPPRKESTAETEWSSTGSSCNPRSHVPLIGASSQTWPISEQAREKQHRLLGGSLT
jgi:hypothetical protein